MHLANVVGNVGSMGQEQPLRAFTTSDWSFPGRPVGRVAMFLPDGKLAKRPAGVAAGLRDRQAYDKGTRLGASSKGSPTLGNWEDQEPPLGLISAALSFLRLTGPFEGSVPSLCVFPVA